MSHRLGQAQQACGVRGSRMRPHSKVSHRPGNAARNTKTHDCALNRRGVWSGRPLGAKLKVIWRRNKARLPRVGVILAGRNFRPSQSVNRCGGRCLFEGGDDWYVAASSRKTHTPSMTHD
ncbi:hypothetical protein ZHAS_00016197 [Anopheles sinensis]|uniref:Uncharacterized protein n=1 Tax=Anopheles sinensis TaxID=74873 RepID=A0A084WD40_ANOSI|nr:hypothetical protein ZHAS_00016197 [Anopheles sinensis]